MEAQNPGSRDAPPLSLLPLAANSSRLGQRFRGRCGDWVGLLLREGIRGFKGWRFVTCSQELTHQATYCWTPASLSLPLSSSSCFLLFTSTVYFWVLLLQCVWGYGISLRQWSMTGIVLLCIPSTGPTLQFWGANLAGIPR
jgi:hypothetical protein